MRKTSAILILAFTSCGEQEDPSRFTTEEELGLTHGSAGMSTRWQVSPATPAAPPAAETALLPDAGAHRLIVIADPVALELAGTVLEAPFEQAHPDVDLVLVKTDRRNSVMHVLTGDADAALVVDVLADRDHRRGLTEVLLGYHIPALVCHPSNGTSSLDPKQVRFLLTGQVGDWTWFGLHQGPPVLVFPANHARSSLYGQVLMPGHVLSGSGPRLATDREIFAEVQRHPGALGLVCAASLGRAEVSVLTLDGVDPSLENFLGGTYPYGREVRLVARDSSRAVLSRFLEFVTGPEGRRLLSPTLTTPR